MAVLFEFAEADRLLRMTLEGQITNPILFDTWSKAVTVTAALPACRNIVDLSRVTQIEVTSDLVASFARMLPARPEIHTQVFVAPGTVAYGMSRMFQTLADQTRNLHVVHTMEEAYKLLGVESPIFVPVSDTEKKSCPISPATPTDDPQRKIG